MSTTTRRSDAPLPVVYGTLWTRIYVGEDRRQYYLHRDTDAIAVRFYGETTIKADPRRFQRCPESELIAAALEAGKRIAARGTVAPTMVAPRAD